MCPVLFDAHHFGGSAAGPYVLEQWLVASHASLEPGTPILRVAAGSRRLELRSNMKGVVMDRRQEEGATLIDGVPLVDIGAEGEDIPYGQRFFAVASVVER